MLNWTKVTLDYPREGNDNMKEPKRSKGEEMRSPRIQPRPSVPIPRLIACGGGGGAPAQGGSSNSCKRKEAVGDDHQIHLKGEHMRSNLPHSQWLRPVLNRVGWVALLDEVKVRITAVSIFQKFQT